MTIDIDVLDPRRRAGHRLPGAGRHQLLPAQGSAAARRRAVRHRRLRRNGGGPGVRRRRRDAAYRGEADAGSAGCGVRAAVLASARLFPYFRALIEIANPTGCRVRHAELPTCLEDLSALQCSRPPINLTRATSVDYLRRSTNPDRQCAIRVICCSATPGSRPRASRARCRARARGQVAEAAGVGVALADAVGELALRSMSCWRVAASDGGRCCRAEHESRPRHSASSWRSSCCSSRRTMRMTLAATRALYLRAAVERRHELLVEQQLDGAEEFVGGRAVMHRLRLLRVRGLTTRRTYESDQLQQLPLGLGGAAADARQLDALASRRRGRCAPG